MALVLIDRAQETATANTTVSFTLLGATTGYQTLASVGDTNTTYYGATDGTNWEVGIGTYSTTGPTLTRDTILSSSNAGDAVSTFTSPLTIWIDYPAGRAVYGPIDETSVAIGAGAGNNNQGDGAVSVGYFAGYQNQGATAVAIGVGAGAVDQPANSIIIKASSDEQLNGTNAGLYIDPVRNDTGSVTNGVYYNTSTKELTYAPGYDPANVAITGGTINNTVIGGTTPAAGTFTTITGQTANLTGTGNNYFTNTTVLSNATWTLTNLTATTGQTDPFGGTTASLLTDNSTNGQHTFYKTVGSANIYTMSVYAKAGSANGGTANNFIKLHFGGTGSGTWFNLTTGAMVTNNATAYSSTNVGGGWWRFSTTNTQTGAALCGFQMSPDGSTASYVGTGSTIFISSPQLEIGSVLNPYIANSTGTAITGFPSLSLLGIPAIQVDTTGSLSVQPQGTGALQAQATTSSAVGGNARGANAVDWLTSRTAASQVASGALSVIAGGNRNTASGIVAFVGGGTDQVASGVNTFVGGGQNNTASLNFATICGGRANTAAGYYNFIGAGWTNSGTSGTAVTTQTTTIAITAGTTIYLSSANANIRVGAYISGTGISSDTYATSTVTTGTPAVMNTSTISGTTLTVGTLASGTIIAGQVLTGTGVTAGTYIVSGSASTWTVSVSQTVASTTITGTARTITISQNATTAAGVTLSFFTPHGVVVGGGNNQATGAYSFIGGGGDAGTAGNRNSAAGDWSSIVGGLKNTIASTSQYSVIAGGFNSGIIGNGYSFLGGGVLHSLSTDYTSIVGGYSNLASGRFSFVAGGGYGSTRAINGNHVFSACFSPIASSAGVSQSALLILARETTDATATALASNASAVSSTNQVILPNNSAYYFRGSVIAGVTGAGNAKAWSFEGAIERGADAASTAIIGTVILNTIAQDAGASTWSIAITADTTNGGIRVTVTGQAATTIRWVCKIETTEMTF
jgi:hypothetical protein